MHGAPGQDVPMADILSALDALTRLPEERQRDLAGRMAMIIAPFGSVEPKVVAPDTFRDLIATLPLVEGDAAAGAALVSRCHEVIERFDDEPAGSGFFAFGAVVEALYCAEALTKSASVGVVNCANRFLDLLDAADGGESAGLCDLGVEWLGAPTVEAEQRLEQGVVDHARRLVENT